MRLRTIIQLTILISSFVTLIFLGTWQVERLKWKNDIIAQLDKEYAKNPSDVIFTFQDLNRPTTDVLDLRYGTVKGEFIYDKEILMGPSAHEKEISYQVITPMKLTSGEYILIQRGWLKEADKVQAKDKANRPKGIVTLTAIVRTPEWNSFTSNNSPSNNIWMKLDIDEIAEAKNLTPIAPVVAYVEKSDKEFGLVSIQTEKQYPRNNHQQYAFFWYGMAFILLIISGLYAAQIRRKRT